MPPPSPMDELLTAVPTREALDQAHLQAMRGMSDHIAQLGRNYEALAKDVRETRDAALELKAQDLKATIAANRVEALTAVKEVDDKTDANARAISRIQGLFLPLGAAGAGLLAFLGELAANLASGHHP